MTRIILGIESSCDETAAAVLVDGVLRSNVVASQEVHALWGGVVPELASRAHQEHIVPVVAQALKAARVSKHQLDAVAFTRGPGLIGALLVGTCFARSLAQALKIPLVAVDHVQAHALAHFIQDGKTRPVLSFPFLNLTVSGGHTQLVIVRSALEMEVIGNTLDDAAGEAFDKGAKVLGLPYPGGPLIDRYAAQGNPARFKLPKPAIEGLNMSFSGIKTAFVALVHREEGKRSGFKESERADLCASLQQAIIDHLLAKVKRAVKEHALSQVGVAGGVASNSALRQQLSELGEREGFSTFFPPPAYCTDNAAMIATAGQALLLAGLTAPLDVVPEPRSH